MRERERIERIETEERDERGTCAQVLCVHQREPPLVGFEESSCMEIMVLQ